MSSSGNRRVLLVPDSGFYLAFRVLPILHRSGCTVDVLSLPHEALTQSRYVAEVFVEPDDRRRLAWLVEKLREPDRWQTVVIPHEALTRGLMNDGPEDFLRRWQPGLFEGEAREFFLSKLGLAGTPDIPGLNLPPGIVCHSVDAIIAFADRTGWPVIIKPAQGTGGRNVQLLETPGQVRSACPAGLFPLLAQKYITGREGIVSMVCSQGRVLAWLNSETTAKVGRFGHSTGRRFEATPELRPLVEATASFSRVEGFSGFDWIQESSTGRYFLIEFHPRGTSGLRFGRCCGVDFAAAVAAWLDGRATSFATQTQPPGASVEARYFPQDFMRCCRDRDWRGLRHWLPGSETVHDIFWDDPKPLLAQGINRILGRRNSA